MLISIVRDNIDDRVLNRVSALLLDGGVVAYPTDSSWSLGCSANSKNGIERLKKFKGGQAFVPTLFCKDLSQASEFVDLPNAAFRYVKHLVPGPYVFVLEPRGALEKIAHMKRLEVGLRIPDHPIPISIVDQLGFPLLSITASRKMTQEGWWDDEFAEENLFETAQEVLEIPGVDLVLDTGEELPKVLSTVVSLKTGEPIVLRNGVGKLD